MELAVDIPAPVIVTKFDEPLMNAAILAQSSVKEETVDMKALLGKVPHPASSNHTAANSTSPCVTQ